MQIEIFRGIPEPDGDTFGTVHIDGAAFCLAQEPPRRVDRLFVPGESALPLGDYNVSLEHSPRHRCLLPLLAALPHESERRVMPIRLGMRIHHGFQTERAFGEIVVGYRRLADFLVETEPAFKELFAQIETAKAGGESVELTIR